MTLTYVCLLQHESRWEFSRNKLIFDRLLGEGEHGRVLLAQALNIRGHTGYTPVAVKMMKCKYGWNFRKPKLQKLHMHEIPREPVTDVV